MKNLTFLFLSVLLTMSHKISAHEFWLEPNLFYQEKGQQIDISLLVGENMKGDTLPNIPAWYEKFDVITNHGLKEIEGSLGDDPAGYFKHKTPGIYALGYLSQWTKASLKQSKFHEYLISEGLEKIIEQRKSLNENLKDGREIFFRNAKSLVKIGHQQDVNFYDYDFGHPLNITPLKNPYDLSVGDQLPVKVTFNQQPAAHLLLKAQIKNNNDFRFSVRTDEQGYASIPLDHSGIWLIHLVDMHRSQQENIDWESFWASLTFEIR